jgi:hypothetical protein
VFLVTGTLVLIFLEEGVATVAGTKSTETAAEK